MEQWQQDNRRDVVMVDIDQLVPKDHLLRKQSFSFQILPRAIKYSVCRI